MSFFFYYFFFPDLESSFVFLIFFGSWILFLHDFLTSDSPFRYNAANVFEFFSWFFAARGFSIFGLGLGFRTFVRSEPFVWCDVRWLGLGLGIDPIA